MPRKTATPQSPRQKQAQAQALAKKVLNAALESEEDVEDEEEDEDDNPWEWMYEITLKSGKSSTTQDPTNGDNGKKIGFRCKDGGLECRIGDCVLLKAPGSAQPWVGMIKEFVGKDDEGDECAEFMWFCDEKEVHNKLKKRKDFLQNELYITTGCDESPIESIISKATILDEKTFTGRFPPEKMARKIPRAMREELSTTFVCRRCCNLGTTTYTDEFDWNDIEHNTEEDIDELLARFELETESKKRKKRRPIKRKREEYDDEGAEEDDEIEKNDIMGTPRKKKKNSVAMTPQKPRTPSKLLTPSHKRIVVKKPLEFTPLGTRILDADHVYSSPFQTARSRLHVSSVPTSLPCREDEFASVYSHLEAAIYEGTGSCIYISGTPGTGKTATVREVVAQLNSLVMAEELDDFIFVEVNGMKVTDPHQSYSLLWEALKGDRVSPSHALDLLEREFSHPSPRRVPCVVLMDELDQLVTKNQSVMYNFFNWPGLRHSKLIVLAVANTMDLPERTLSNKISSRLGLTRITFPGYTHDQLMRIIQSRLEGVAGDIVDSDAIQFASRKVAAVSGDARRCLDICRRAVELAEAESQNIVPNTPSKSGKGEKISRSAGKVTIATIKRAINEATTSPLQQYLRGLPLSSKILLAALLIKSRRTGIAESVMGDVLDEARRMAKMDTDGKTAEYLLKDDAKRTSTNTWTTHSKSSRVLGMGLSAIDLMEAGIIGLEARKTDRTGKIRLAIGEEDLKLAFKDDPEVKNLGVTV